MSELPTAPIEVTALDCGFLMALLLDEKHRGSEVAKNLYFKLKAAAIAVGVEWRYGDPKGWEKP